MFAGEKFKYVFTGWHMNLNRVRLAWHMTDWCNYNCPYCIQTVEHHYGIKPKETQEYVEDMAKILRPKFTNQNFTLTLYGGEISRNFDLCRILDILFKDNNSVGSATLLTNLSAPKQVYYDYIYHYINGVKPVIIPSYQWSPIDEFLDKCVMIQNKIGNSYQTTCVVYDKISLEQLKTTASKFKEAGVALKLVHGRIPSTGNKLFDLQDGVREFIDEWNQTVFDKTTCSLTYADGTVKDCQSRSDILKEVADWQGLPGASFKGMRCFTGWNLTPNGNLRPGSCPDKRKKQIINIFETNDFSLKPYQADCTTDEYCNLCNSVLIWNKKL